MSEDYTGSQSYKEAYLLAARYCSTAERCFFDVRIKLKRWNVSQQFEDAIFENLQKEQFVDEQRYSNAFVKDKFRLGGWGRIKIQYHLRQKNISNSIIKQSMDSFIDETEYLERLNTLIEKKNLTVKANDQYAKKVKLIQFAQSRGFEVYLASTIVDGVMNL